MAARTGKIAMEVQLVQTMFSLIFLLTRVWGTYAEGQYVGDEASEWFSNYLNKTGYKMYKLSKPRLIHDDKTWGDVALPDDKVGRGK